MKKRIKSSCIVKTAGFIFFHALSLFSIALLYISNTWDNISLNEIIFHTKQPLNGLSRNLVFSCFMQTIVPFLIFIIIYIQTQYRKFINWLIIFTFLILSVNAFINLNVFDYIKYRGLTSNFIENNYIDPVNTRITFNKKRNLIYIFLESMESSFADKSHGGYFNENLIPELTKLAEENINFSQKSDALNGAYSPSFTTWTMAAIFAQSTGLPLQIPIEDNNMHSQEDFFPSIVGLGDILEQNGYYQEVIMGSNAYFTGMKNFFEQHGKYFVLDFNAMIDHGIISKKQKIHWGMDDNKLFETAKERILLASENKDPFNITIITMDTHYDGKPGPYCENKFEENEYKHVIHCADTQISSFVRWAQRQDFYKNTTIVISGDHPSMKSNFIDNRQYTRKVYNTYINPYDIPEKSTQRTFSVFDNFPTTLASLGAVIPGNRLGLGVNLFSDEKTLAERYGYNYLDRELSKKSLFFNDKMNFNIQNVTINSAPQFYGTQIQTHTRQNTVTIEVDLANMNHKATKHGSYQEIHEIDFSRPLVAHIYEYDNLNYKKFIMLKHIKDKLFTANIKLSEFSNSYGYIQVYAQDKNGNQLLLGTLQGDMRDFNKYVQHIKSENYAVFITIHPHPSKIMTMQLKSGLKELGLHADFPYNYWLGYYAVLDGDNIIEQNATDITSSGVEYSSFLSGNKAISYSVMSNNFNITDGGSSSIIIGDKKCSNNAPGLNIVVYDNKLNKVVDSTTF